MGAGGWAPGTRGWREPVVAVLGLWLGLPATPSCGEHLLSANGCEGCEVRGPQSWAVGVNTGWVGWLLATALAGRIALVMPRPTRAATYTHAASPSQPGPFSHPNPGTLPDPQHSRTPPPHPSLAAPLPRNAGAQPGDVLCMAGAGVARAVAPVAAPAAATGSRQNPGPASGPSLGAGAGAGALVRGDHYFTLSVNVPRADSLCGPSQALLRRLALIDSTLPRAGVRAERVRSSRRGVQSEEEGVDGGPGGSGESGASGGT